MKFSLDRRHFVRSLAAIPCAIAAYFIYEEITEDDGIVRTIGAPSLPSPSPVVLPADQNHLCFLAVGDTGLASPSRALVIKQMLYQNQSIRADFISLLGDNFYEAGVESIDDPKWQAHFELPFSSERFDVPFYCCLGNHDYYGNIAAQVEYATQHPRWRMPSPYYTFTRSVDAHSSAEFFVLDTTPIEEGDHSTRAQIKWLEDKLRRSTADWNIVMGHHPLYSGGEHGRSWRNFKHLAPLFDKYQIDLYICGHDHDLQLHDPGRGWLHLTSGAGSKLRSVRWVDTTLFAEATAGFARVIVSANQLNIEIFGIDGLRFCHQRPQKRQLANAGKRDWG